MFGLSVLLPVLLLFWLSLFLKVLYINKVMTYVADAVAAGQQEQRVPGFQGAVHHHVEAGKLSLYIQTNKQTTNNKIKTKMLVMNSLTKRLLKI